MFPLWTDNSSLCSSAFIETAIKRERHIVPKATLQLIYRALIHPHFNYCNTIWGNCGITLTNKLQKLQNRAARVGHFQTTMKTLATCLNSWMEKSSAPVSPVKSLHGLAPEYLSSWFAIRETAYNLRDSENKLCIPLPRTNYYKNSFSYSGSILWNKLPIMWGKQICRRPKCNKRP